MKAVLFGATKGMGRALARAMAERGEHVFLIGRDRDQLERSAQDLAARGAGGKVGIAHCDLLEPHGFDAALGAAEVALGGFDTVVISAALFGTQEELEADPELCARLVTANFGNTLLFLEAARKRLLENGGGTLCAFSSVAGERGRKPVVIYGATKAGLSAYMEGLDHRFHDQGLRAVLVKPGFVKTGMTIDLDPPPFAGEPRAVAIEVLDAIDRGRPVVYTPRIWRWIMLVIRSLPRFVMRRIGF